MTVVVVVVLFATSIAGFVALGRGTWGKAVHREGGDPLMPISNRDLPVTLHDPPLADLNARSTDGDLSTTMNFAERHPGRLVLIAVGVVAGVPAVIAVPSVTEGGLFVGYLLVFIAFLFAIAVVVCLLALALVGLVRAVRPRPNGDRNHRTMKVFARALVAGVLGLIVTIGVLAALLVAAV